LYGAITPSITDLTELTVLDLSNNSFMGGIPTQISRCKELTEFNVAYNLLTADVPLELGFLTKLKVLRINDNNLYGILPPTFSNLTHLAHLSVAGNMLSGYPFETISILKNLEFLDLSSNKFKGSVLNQTVVNWPKLAKFIARANNFDNVLPATLGNLVALQELDISQNSIQGTIPDKINKCGNLVIMNLSCNALSGAIPSAVGEIPTLSVLDLRANSFNSGLPTGINGYNNLVRLQVSRNNFLAIPDDLATLPNILDVDISQNHLEGVIPSTLGTMTRVLSLNFSYNNLSSNIPPQIGDCARLSVLDLSHNLLKEIIPYTIIKMRSLECLNLSENHLSGRLPEEFGYLSELTELDVSGNAIGGTIPAAIGTLPRLTFLDLAFNKLSGIIPTNLNFPASSFVGNADLCGPILNKSCTTYVGRTVAPGGMMVSAAGLVLTMTVIMILTWWFCCRDETDELNSSFPAGVLRRLTSEALQRATEDFSSINYIGSSALCTVYKAELSDGLEVAVKVLSPEYYGSNRRSFSMEAKMFAKVLHPNIVKVVGCCNSVNMVALVSELMPNGSLEKHLYAGEVCDLTWIQRLDIILGIAEAVAYMHHEWESLLWCDFRTRSILLDALFKPHISNYRIAGNPSSEENLPPAEYMFSSIRTREGDVFSYGVLILEVLTRISPQGDVSWQGGLALWVQQFYPTTLSDILDPQIMELKHHHTSIVLCTELALLCTQESPQERPTMSDVVHMLQRIRR
ncbi:hypothetical protein SELMODRAFT_30430, partial [Selaginella moellendorffii]